MQRQLYGILSPSIPTSQRSETMAANILVALGTRSAMVETLVDRRETQARPSWEAGIRAICETAWDQAEQRRHGAEGEEQATERPQEAPA